jgi:hypothetical protein
LVIRLSHVEEELGEGGDEELLLNWSTCLVMEFGHEPEQTFEKTFVLLWELLEDERDVYE